MFVTCYYDIYNNVEYQDKYFKLFEVFAKSNLPFCIFTDPIFNDRFQELLKGTTHKYLHILSLDNTEIYQIGTKPNINLPQYRNESKDTLEYLALQNTKVEFIKKASELYSTYDKYIWVDFGIIKILKNDSEIIDFITKLNFINSTNWNTAHYNNILLKEIIMIPGCWGKSSILISNVNWRFCGGIIIIPSGLITSFFEICKQTFLEYCSLHSSTWEVNIWAIIENKGDFDTLFLWYKADHNSTILPSWDYLKTIQNL